MKRFTLHIFIFLVLAVSSASATTIVLPSDDQLIAKTPVIVTGRVIDSVAVERNGGIYTETSVAVERALKGTTEPTILIREIGGRIGDRLNVVFGSPEYKAGQKVLVFLWPREDGTYQTRDLFIGKFHERFTTDGTPLWYRAPEANGTELLDRDLQPLATRNVQRHAERFSTYVKERAAGRARTRDYEIENPTLVREDRFQANFTLIDEPNVYRWFAFERGSIANWVSYGTQPGYAGGGIEQAKTGMAVWNTSPGAKITYVYAGTSSVTPGGLSKPNGLNEVVFNDPLNEIDGSYSGSSGGVIGRGGFNNVKAGGSWTSGSPVKSYASTGDIVEGNLVIQDGVSFSSSLLAAVLAHEFGHTLGFGHSADPSALMYASLKSGTTAALAPDDQAAAQWLYPGSGGSGGTPPPAQPTAAPSNLTASVVNGTQIHLKWTVNATSASWQTVYVAVGTGNFSKAGDVGANANAAYLSNLQAGATYRIYVTATSTAGESQPSNIAQATLPMPGSPNLSLQSNRFRLSLSARDQRSGKSGAGYAMPQNDLFGYFSIPDLTGNVNNPEVFVKVLDGRPVNGTFWVFYGGLTDLEYTLTVTDTFTGVAKNYLKAAGSTCGGFDTGAFTSAAEVDPAPLLTDPIEPANGPVIVTEDVELNACSAGGGNLCALSGRFRITLTARDPRSGATAAGQSLPQNDLFGYFSIPGLTGNSANPEVFVKMLDGRAVNGRFWIFWGGLTDLEYTVRVTDTLTGKVQQYTKPAGSACGGNDTSAF